MGNGIARPGAHVDPFPHGWDYAWLAHDSVGHIAIFLNGGQGPIPSVIVKNRNTADNAEHLVKSLPLRGDCELFVFPPRPDDLVAYAQRGLFVYDWQDVERRAGHTDSYELVARPRVPADLEALAPTVATLVRMVYFETLRFEASTRIRVEAYVSCYPD